MPDMTAQQEAAARATFLRANFERRLRLAELEEEYREAQIASPPRAQPESAAQAQLDATVESMRAKAKTPSERRAAEAYRRIASQLLALEATAVPEESDSPED